MFNSTQDAEDFGRDLAISTKDAINKALEKRCSVIEAKLARLEAMIEQKNFAYMGVWKDGKVYGPGSFVTYSGALWHCNQFNTTTRPGDGAAAWTLAVKSGAPR